jgi:hypothetical protein
VALHATKASEELSVGRLYRLETHKVLASFCFPNRVSSDIHERHEDSSSRPASRRDKVLCASESGHVYMLRGINAARV